MTRHRGEELPMTLMVWLVIGGLAGWQASVLMGTDARQDMTLNIVAGIVGAVLGGWLLSGLVDSGSIDQSDFRVSAVLVALLGAVFLLSVVKFVRNNALR